MLTIKRLPEYLGCTPGMIYHDEALLCFSIELPWRDNLPNISCIPTGHYKLMWSWSPKLKRMTIEVLAVPDRLGVRIHDGNRVQDSEGCPIAVTELKVEPSGIWGAQSDHALEKVNSLVRDRPYERDLAIL